MAQRQIDPASARLFDDLSLPALRQRQSDKWRHYPPEILPSFVAEMDFPLAPPIARALTEAISRSDTGYAAGSDAFTEAFAEFALTCFDWTVDPSGLSLIPDVMVGITEFLRAAARPGDGVVINTPVYPPFFSHVQEAGCRVVEAPLAHGTDGYELDLDATEAAFRNGATFYLFCNPHNPTGLVATRAQVERIAELADRYNVTVLADEIHAPLVYPDARHVPFLSVGESAGNRGIAFVSASKGWNIPGLKCAQAVVASDRMRQQVKRMPDELIARVGNLGVIASTAAYGEGVEWLDDLLVVLDRNRRLLADLLTEALPGVRYHPPKGTYLAWIDCRPLNLPKEPVDFFLERGHVALGPGPRFGTLGRGFVRITMATSEAILREIVERMRSALAD